MEEITVRTIVAEYLRSHGYDGLLSIRCGCRLDNLMPCSDEQCPNEDMADADANHWAELARTYGVRLPQWWVACTPAKMRRWLHKLGFSLAWRREWSGWRRFEPWIEANPQRPLRAFVGLLLEEKEACDGQVD